MAAGLDGYPPSLIPARHLANGNYFALSGPAPFARLVYPLPLPGSLGTHYRRDLGGVAHFGPDIEWVDGEDYAVSTSRRPLFAEAIRHYWPGLNDADLQPDYVGIRPKIHGASDPQPDFSILFEPDHRLPGLAALFGIESPGLTGGKGLMRVRRQMARVALER